MADSKIIKTVFVGIIMIAVLGWVTNVMVGMQPTEDTWATEEKEFQTVDEWTLENTAPFTISHNETDEWIDVGADDTGSGSAQISQTVDVGAYQEIEDARAVFDWQIDDATSLTEVTVTGQIIDPDGNVDNIVQNTESDTATWTTENEDISDHVDESGEYEFVLLVEGEVDGSDLETNLDNTQASITANVDQLGVVEKLGEYGPYLVMILIMSFFVLGITVLLRYLNVV